MSKELFVEYPYLYEDEIMQSTAFWEFLNITRYNCYNTFTEAMKIYLAATGFALNVHRVEPKQMYRHRVIYQHFGWCRFRGYGKY